MLDAPEVRHLHAHFAHGTTTIAWHAATITGLPFSFTGHARDIYAEHLNPKGWLRRKLLAARFVVTCTGANVRHLRAIAPEAEIHLVYHGLNADFERMLRRAVRRPATGTATSASSPSAATSPRRASTCSSTPAPSCAHARRPIRGGDRRPGGQALGGDRRSGSRTTACMTMSRLPGAMGQEELLGEYRRASALCMPSRLLADDRDGIPNVLVEAMAAGTPVIASAVSGIPELVEHEVNGLLVAPEDPGGARRHADPPPRRPRALARARRPRPRDRDRRASTAPPHAARLAELFRAAT